MTADDYDFEKLAREIVLTQLSGMAEKAPEAAAQAARRILVSGVTSTHQRQDPHLTVTAVCRGILGGMMVANQDLPQTVVLTLQQLGDASHEVPLSPEDLMTWAMEGFASVAVVAGPRAMDAIEAEIESKIMGAGTVFRNLCEEARNRGRA